MEDKKTFDNGNTYLTHNLLSFGDYDNSCAVERANVKCLKKIYPEYEKFWIEIWDNKETWRGIPINPESEIIEVYGAYGSMQIWIRQDIEEKEEYIRCLEDYPALDDEIVTEIEVEIEEECWNNWIREELIETLPEKMQKKEWEEEELYNTYLEVKEKTGEYFIVESGGDGYINIDKIKSKFRELLEGEGK